MVKFKKYISILTRTEVNYTSVDSSLRYFGFHVNLKMNLAVLFQSIVRNKFFATGQLITKLLVIFEH
jgi:hypothetical protein